MTALYITCLILVSVAAVSLAACCAAIILCRLLQRADDRDRREQNARRAREGDDTAP